MRGKADKNLVTIRLGVPLPVAAKLRKIGKLEGVDFPACGFSLFLKKVIEPRLEEKRKWERMVREAEDLLFEVERL